MFLPALLFAAATAIPACEMYYVDTDEIRLQKVVNGAVSTLVTDGEGITLPRLSRDRRVIAYVRPRLRHEGDQVIATFVFIDRESGKQLRTLEVRQDVFMNAVMDLGWIGAGVVWFEGHYSPRCASYSEVDVRTGKVLRDLHVGTWARSSRGVIAYTPCAQPPEEDFLQIGERLIFPPKDGRKKHLFASSQTWSPDGKRIALADFQPTAGTLDLVILDPSSGRVLRRTRIRRRDDSITPSSVRFLVYREDGTILVTVGETTFRVTPAGRITPLGRQLLEPWERSVEAEGKAHTLEDTTCPPERYSYR